jgi:hypothetical protein
MASATAGAFGPRRLPWPDRELGVESASTMRTTLIIRNNVLKVARAVMEEEWVFFMGFLCCVLLL